MTLLRSFATIPDFINWAFGIDWFRGFPINTFGFFVACSFLVAAYFIHKELKRRKELGIFPGKDAKITEGAMPSVMDVLPSILVGFILGYKFIGGFYERDIMMEDPQGYFISLSHGSMLWGIIISVLMGGYQYWSIWKERLPEPVEKDIKLYPHDYTGDIIMVCAVFGILGANIFEVFNDPDYLKSFINDPIKSMFSGMTIVGGLVFGIISMVIFALMKKISIAHLFDALGPAVMIAYAVGRIGCQVSGDGDWGIVNTLDKPGWIPQKLWIQHYEHNVINSSTTDNIGYIHGCAEKYCTYLVDGVFPTPVYEIIVCSMLFLVLWFIRKPLLKFPGMLWAVFMIMNGVERFFIEFIRITARHDYFGITLTQAQFVSILFVIIGIGLIIALKVYYGKYPEQQPQTG